MFSRRQPYDCGRQVELVCRMEAHRRSESSTWQRRTGKRPRSDGNELLAASERVLPAGRIVDIICMCRATYGCRLSEFCIVGADPRRLVAFTDRETCSHKFLAELNPKGKVLEIP